MRRFIVMLSVICVLSLFASAKEAHVYDYADIYTDDEEFEISQKAEKVFDSCGLRCVIVTDFGVGTVNDAFMCDYASDAEDMLLLVIDMEIREFDLYQYNDTNNEDEFKISKKEADKILDAVENDMKNGDFADAAKAFIETSEEYFNSDESLGIGDILIYALVGAVIGGIVVLIVRFSYKNKVHGSTYPLSQYSKLELTASNDNFINKTVVVTHIPDPPSNSGKGSGGGVRMGGRKF